MRIYVVVDIYTHKIKDVRMTIKEAYIVAGQYGNCRVESGFLLID